MLVLAFFAISAAPPAQKLAVMPLRNNGVSPEAVRILDELLTTELYDHSAYTVISAADVNAMIGLEKMKDAMGCSDASCMAEIGGALGVDAIISGSVGKLGGELFINLSLLDMHQKKAAVRASARVAAEERAYAPALEKAVAELLKRSNVDVPREIVMKADPPAVKAIELEPAEKARRTKIAFGVVSTVLAVAAITTGIILFAGARSEQAIAQNEYQRFLELPSGQAADTAYASVVSEVQRSNTQRGVAGTFLGFGGAFTGLAIGLFASGAKK